MKYTIIFEVLQWAAKNYAEDLIKAVIDLARQWAEDDGVEDWDDYAVDVLEKLAYYLLERYKEEDFSE